MLQSGPSLFSCFLSLVALTHLYSFPEPLLHRIRAPGRRVTPVPSSVGNAVTQSMSPCSSTAFFRLYIENIPSVVYMKYFYKGPGFLLSWTGTFSCCSALDVYSPGWLLIAESHVYSSFHVTESLPQGIVHQFIFVPGFPILKKICGYSELGKQSSIGLNACLSFQGSSHKSTVSLLKDII